MAIIIDLFTKKQILESCFAEEKPQWDFENIKERIRASFGKDMPKFVEKAWLKPQTEPYRFGCTHNIRYRSTKERYWNKPMPFPMPIDPKTDVIGKKVMQGGTDPCAWIDHKYQVTLNHIKSRRGKTLVIHTRSDLIANDDYIEAIDKHHHRVVMYFLDAVDTEVRYQELGAPSNKRRREAIDRLVAHGIAVQVVHLDCSVFASKERA